MFNPDTIRDLIITVPALVLAIVCHEVSHGFVAYRLGDPTAKMLGRLTLNPISHVDPIGTIIMPMILFMTGAPVLGYAKPVPINPMNFKNPKKDMAVSAAAGPITNLLIAILSSLTIAVIIIPLSAVLPAVITKTILMPLALMLQYSIKINLFLAAFNLIPIPPLDGGRVLVGFLPHNQAVSYSKIEPYGFIIIFGLIIVGAAAYIIFPIYQLLSLLVPFY